MQNSHQRVYVSIAILFLGLGAGLFQAGCGKGQGRSIPSEEVQSTTSEEVIQKEVSIENDYLFKEKEKESVEEVDLVVSGIMMSERPIAIVNGNVVSEGGRIDKARVIEIGNQYVIFEIDGVQVRKKIASNISEEKKATDLERFYERQQRNQKVLTRWKKEKALASSGPSDKGNLIDESANDKKIKKPSLIKSREVVKAVLKIFYELGQFDGYVIFYNQKGEQCAVKGEYSFPAKIYIGEPKFLVTSRELIKEFRIQPEDFRYLELKNGSLIYAYPVAPFVLSNIKSEKIKIQFEWEGIKSRDEVYLID